MNSEIKFQDIDKKQQARWEKANLFKSPRLPKPGKKFYCLDMFPYPSGAGLHVGHPEGYTASDIIIRYKKMNGFDVLHPMGWDAFGLPAENYAIATGVHPRITTEKNIDNYRRQIKSIGLAYDWDREINTTDPAYYKWTQWIFLQLFKKGLAYESDLPINWCPSCKTGLANEEVFNGKCERCSTPIERKNLRQWVLRITDYAERLLTDLDGLDWPESTLSMQKNWIGKSEGAEVIFKIKGGGQDVTVFTTRPDTLFGATYMVLAPEHPLVKEITTADKKEEVEKYIAAAGAKSDFDRAELNKQKTGVFTGALAVNPVNGAEVPVWISDYVLMGYGTGAIMAVPAHDERDYEFATKFGINITEVISGGDISKSAYTGDGNLVNSGFLNGLNVEEAKQKITAFLEEKGLGKKKISYRLRDWIFSRQRYWGEPIPLIHCPKCGVVPVPEEQLPLVLPEVDKFEPSGTGESPLASVESWINTKCPQCAGAAKRESNTMPQWAGSCWYYLRYLDPKNDKVFVDPEIEKAYMPVDCYIGGAEHAVLHLLYARFWHKVLYDLGHVSTKEPFQKLKHQGMILAYSYRDENGVYHGYDEVEQTAGGPKLKATGAALKSIVEKMSKSKKNVVNPDDILAEYGADAFRMYEMFMGPFDATKPWDMKGIEGVNRFLKRVWAWGEKVKLTDAALPKEMYVLQNKTIIKTASDIETYGFNTAVSGLMILFNEIGKLQEINKNSFEVFVKLLYPFAPHITEELWQMKGGQDFLYNSAWPAADQNALEEDEIEIGVQVNGKTRGRVKVPAGADQALAAEAALKDENVKKFTDGKQIIKTIFIPKKMVSFVIK